MEIALLVIIAILAAIYLASYAFTVMTIDTGRDWAQAWQIASGTAFTATGPALKVDVFHFGPLWFYLLGGLFWLTHSLTLTSLAVGVLAALKFPLAYVCGCRLLDKRMGLLWALILAMPGWQTMEQVHITHINLVETLTLLVIYLLIRYTREGGGRWLVALGLAMGLALHAHPSTAPLGLLALGVYLYRWVRFRELYFMSLLAAVALFLLPFLPYVISQTLQGWPDWQQASGYLQSETGIASLRKLPQLLWSTLVYAPRLFALSAFSTTGFATAWLAATYGLSVFAIAGLLWSLLTGRHRWLIFLGSLALLIVVAGVLYLRPQTPYYMSYVLYPFIALLLALGLHAWGRRLGGKLMIFCALWVLALSTAVSAGLLQVHRSGEGGFPGGLFMDIAGGKFGKPGRDLRFPAMDQDDLGRYLCGLGARVVVHGDLAFIVDASFNTGVRLHCGERTRVTIAGRGGTGKDTHVAGLTRRVWQLLGQPPSRWVGPFGLTRALTVIAPVQGIPLPPADRYPPRSYQKKSLEKQHWHFSLPSGQVLVIGNPFPWYLPIKGVKVVVDGHTLEPVARTRASRVYGPIYCEAEANCEANVELRTARRDWVDIFAFPGKR